MILSFSFKDGARLALLSVVFSLASSPLARAFTAEETMVSARGVPMPDIEFDRASYQVTWEDQSERLWVAPVIPGDGSFDLANAIQLDSGLAPLAGFQTGNGTANGPEWCFTTGDSQILYTKSLGTTRGELEVYHAMIQNGAWVAGPFADANLLPYGPKGYVPIGNTRLDDPSPAFCFYHDDANGGTPNLDWRKLDSPTGSIVTKNLNGIARWASGTSNLLVYPAVAKDGSKQIFLFDTDKLKTTQLTTSNTVKSDCWLFAVPELGGEQVLATMERSQNADTVLVIYRKKGSTWTVYNTIRPDSQYADLDSPEPVIFNGQSYMMCVARASNDKSLPSEVWLLSIRKDTPFSREVSDHSIERPRQDPEYLVTPNGLLIYYTLVGPESVYRCQTGMGPAASNIIYGTAGDDVLKGTANDDLIIGGPGADTLGGGAGVDQFVYEHPTDGGDTIADFEVDKDYINMTLLMANLGYKGSDPIVDGYVRIKLSGSNSKIYIDPDGSAGPKNAKLFITVLNVTPEFLSDPANFLF